MTSSQVLAALLLCGLMGLIGQGIRATVGLKNASQQGSTPTQQTEFNAAYFLLSMMIGFIAGVLAGLGMGLKQVANFPDPLSITPLLGIAVAGYAGADFIENAFSGIMPGLGGTKTNSASIVADVAGVLSSPQTQRILPEVPALVPKPLVSESTLTAAFRIAAPKVSADRWVQPLLGAFAKFDLNSDRRVAAAVGQFLVEAGAAFQSLIEDMYYTHAEELLKVFPSSFLSAAAAQPYLCKPEALANFVYADKLGNGSPESGDGYTFRGRGLIQLTGRDAYTEFGETIGMTAERAAAYCETPDGAAMSGCWYFASKGCLLLADSWNLPQITQRVNGKAMRGNLQRIAYANDVLKALGGHLAVPGVGAP